MTNVYEQLEALDGKQKAQWHQRLAQTALLQYNMPGAVVHFVKQANAGFVYHVQTEKKQWSEDRLLLKVLAPSGENENPPPEQVRSVLLWLAALARETTVVVQEPHANRSGDLLSQVPFPGRHSPLLCVLQRWIDGEAASGDLTCGQARELGTMMAQLHEHARHWARALTLEATEFDETWLDEQLRRFEQARSLETLSQEEWITVQMACDQIRAVMEKLGKHAHVWGPVHGDLHQENILFRAGSVCPLDFECLYRAHFLYDLGVSLYHLLYLKDAAVRQALLEGYQSIRKLDDLPPLALEAFVCLAALANLAFQVTLPQQRTSPLLRHNLHEFVSIFCRKLVAHEPFALL